MINVPSFYEILQNCCSEKNHDIAKDVLQTIREQKVLQDYEVEILDAFNKLVKTSGKIPTVDAVRQAIPSFRKDSDLVIEDIQVASRLFIQNRLNKQMSNKLLNLAEIVAKEGITESVVDQLDKMTMSDAAVSTYEKIQDQISEIYRRTVDNHGIKTHTRKIDDVIGGLKPGQISTIAGYTSAGKSMFCVSLMHEAIKQGYNVCYITLEIPKDHVLFNLISRHSVDTLPDGRPRFERKLSHGAMKDRTLAMDEWEYCEKAILPSLEKLPGKYYIVADADFEAKTYYSFTTKLQEIDELCVSESGKGIDLVIVDYVQMFKFAEDLTGRASEFEITNKWVNYFRGQALNFLKSKRQVHVTIAAQINRNGWLKAAKRDGEYDLTALAESNEIEKASSIIIALFSDERLKESKEVKFQILKNRDGMKKERVDTIYGDFMYAMIGGESNTSDNDIVETAFDDLGEVSNSDIDVSHVTQVEIIDDQFDF